MTDPWWASMVPEADQARARGRSRSTRGVVSTLVAVLLVGGVLTNALIGSRTPDVVHHAWGWTKRPSVQALVLDCGPLTAVRKSSAKVGWLDPQRFAQLPYSTPVPAMGWFYPDPPGADEVSPAVEAVVREMWAGGRVAWYSPDADRQVRDQLVALAKANPQWHMRVARWPSGRESMGATVAFATWGATQSCGAVSGDVARAVWAAGVRAPGADGREPSPVAVLDDASDS